MATPHLTRITAQDAEADAPTDRTFAERPAATPATQFPKRSFAISVMSPAGFPVTVTLNDMMLDQLDGALATLLERGYMPAEVPSVLPSPNAATATAQPAAPTGEAPICPVHTDRRMKPSNYGGYFCTAANLATGEKCVQKVK